MPATPCEIFVGGADQACDRDARADPGARGDDPRVEEGAAALRGSVARVPRECPKRPPVGEMVQATEEHESLIWVPGDLMCRECARGHGTLQAAWVSWVMFRASSFAFAGVFCALLWRRLLPRTSVKGFRALPSPKIHRPFIALCFPSGRERHTI
jgi:hypothetical protein